jgi:lipid-binding SYLF domain-containing protein
VTRHENCYRNMNIRRMATVVPLCLLMPAIVSAADDDAEQSRLKAAGDVLKELLNGPNGVPINLLNKSECVIVLPSVKKAGFIVGASYGRGAMSAEAGRTLMARGAHQS